MPCNIDGKRGLLIFATYFLFWGFLIGFMTYGALETGNVLRLFAVICSGFTCAVVMIFQNGSEA